MSELSAIICSAAEAEALPPPLGCGSFGTSRPPGPRPGCSWTSPPKPQPRRPQRPNPAAGDRCFAELDVRPPNLAPFITTPQFKPKHRPTHRKRQRHPGMRRGTETRVTHSGPRAPGCVAAAGAAGDVRPHAPGRRGDTVAGEHAPDRAARQHPKRSEDTQTTTNSLPPSMMRRTGFV